MTTRQSTVFTITINNEKDGVPCEPVKLEIPVRAAWQISESIVILGVERAAQLLGMGAILLRGQSSTTGSELTLDESVLALGFTTALDREVLGGPWKTHEDRVLAFAYGVLRLDMMKWEPAAQFVTRALGKPITAGALRKRLERWAPDQGFPKIEKYKPRQPRSDKPN